MATREENTEKNKLKVKEVLKLIDSGYDVGEACTKAKISRPTFYHWKRWVVGLEEEKFNFIDLYSKRLQKEIKDRIGLVLKISDCKKVVERVFCVNDEQQPEKTNYIALTAHTF